MRWIDPGADAPAPNICMLCENRPMTQRMLDTGRNYLYDTIPQSPLAGRRMVCEPCVENMGRALGMLPAGEATERFDAALRLQVERDELAARVHWLESGAVESVRDLLEDRTFTKPGPKGPRAAKAETVA